VLDEKLHTHIDKKILAFRYTHSHDEYSTRIKSFDFEGFRFSAIT